MMIKPFIFSLLLAGMCAGNSQAQTRIAGDNSDHILHFASEINVAIDGKISVTENIMVYDGDGSSGRKDNGQMAESHNNSIQEGISREFQTRYKDDDGFFTDTRFKVLSVSKNGVVEPYIKQRISNGIRLKIGSRDIASGPGIYNYRIMYETDRQLLFLGDRDELHWNVNGNGWTLDTDTVSCLVHFPGKAVIGDDACYTGVQDAGDRNCTSRVSGNNSIYFRTIRTLHAYEGLTIAAAIQKGVISPPGKIEDAIFFLRSNYIIPALAAIILFLFFFYYITWHNKSRNPKKGIVHPVFSPPSGLTPPDCGYALDQHYGTHLLTAALADCVISKRLGIERARNEMVSKTNVYHFVKPAEAGVVASTADLYGFDVNMLYGKRAEKSNSNLKMASDALSVALTDRLLARKEKQNKVPGLLALNKGYTQFGLFVIVVALFISFQFMIRRPSLKLAVITCTLLVIIFIIHNIFTRIMSAYTRQGRDITDHLLEFKRYLESAEQPAHNKPPEKTLALFEKYLPHAIALKVENAWEAKFEDLMGQATEQGYTHSYYDAIKNIL